MPPMPPSPRRSAVHTLVLRSGEGNREFAGAARGLTPPSLAIPSAERGFQQADLRLDRIRSGLDRNRRPLDAAIDELIEPRHLLLPAPRLGDQLQQFLRQHPERIPGPRL